MQQRAHAVASAAEWNAGHQRAAAVFDQITEPLVRAIDELLTYEADLDPQWTPELVSLRDEMLTLSHMATSALDDVGHDETSDPFGELLRRWKNVEEQTLRVTHHLCRPLGYRSAPGGADTDEQKQRAPNGLHAAVTERTAQRLRTMSAGSEESHRKLRIAMGLGYGLETGPQQAVERVLELHRRNFVPGATWKEQKAAEREHKDRWAFHQGIWMCVVVFASMAVGAVAANWDQTSRTEGLQTGNQNQSTLGEGFTVVTVSVAVGLMLNTIGLIIPAVTSAVNRRLERRTARRRLAGMQGTLNELTIGLDMTRLDLVAVLGGGSEDDGGAQYAQQRFHEAALVTAWRELQNLENAPRAEQASQQWADRAASVKRLINALAWEKAEVAQRSRELISLSLQQS